MLLGAILLAAAVLSAYAPALRAGYIWDDDEYVTANPLLTAPDGLRRIWFSRDAPSQYFPLVYTVLRWGRAAWGPDAFGFHLLNVVLHIANALLVWLLLSRLGIPAAWFAAALFALHPVQVESVAWVSELKNVLSTFLALLCALAWFRWTGRQPGDSREKHARWYVLALAFFALALTAKTTVATLPIVFLAVHWWRGQVVGPRRWGTLLPFFALAGGMGLVTIWWERTHQGTVGGEFALEPVERFLVAGKALWFYVGKLVWPANLSFSYPRWEVQAGSAGAYLWPLGWMVVVIMLWLMRARLGRGPLAAVVVFTATLGPLLGFIPLHTFKYAFVADHYLYVALLAFAAPASVVLDRLRPRGWRTGIVWVAVAAVPLAFAGTLAWRQAHLYRDGETLWKSVVERYPDRHWMAWNNLGGVYLDGGRHREGIEAFRRSLTIDPGQVYPRVNWGRALAALGRHGEALEQYEVALGIAPKNVDLRVAAVDSLLALGRTGEAERHLVEGLRHDPGHGPAHYRLGWILAGREDHGGARRAFAAAVHLMPANPGARNALGAALASTGLYAEAAVEFGEALRLDPGFIEARFNLGLALRDDGRTAEARRRFEEVLRHQPGYEPARSALEALPPEGARGPAAVPPAPGE